MSSVGQRKLGGMQQDVRRLKTQMGPNAQDQIVAVCRVLNDVKKYRSYLSHFFRGKFGDREQRQTLKNGIRNATILASQHLQARTAKILTPWPICQLFNGICGLLSVKPFAGTDEEQAFQQTLTTLAINLMDALRDSPVLGPPDDLPVEGREARLPYSIILSDVNSLCKAGLIDASAHRELLQSLLNAVSASLDAPGWDCRAITLACSGLGWLLKNNPGLAAALDLHGAANTLALLLFESLDNPYEVEVWKVERLQTRAIDGLKSMLAAGACILPTGDINPIFVQVMKALDLLRPGEASPWVTPSETPQPVVQSGPAEPAPVAKVPLTSDLPAQAPAEELTSVQVEDLSAQGVPIIPKAAHDALHQLNAKTTPKALIRLIDTQEPPISEALSCAGAGDLSKWLLLIAKVGQSSAVADRTVRTLAAVAQQHVQTRSGLSVAELGSLMFALKCSLDRFSACAPEISTALRVLCQRLSETSSKATSLLAVVEAVVGMFPLIVQDDIHAGRALRHVTQLYKAARDPLREEEFQFLKIPPLLSALESVLDKPEVKAFLKQVVVRCTNRKSLSQSSADRAMALAVAISNLPPSSADNDTLLDLLNVLARGLRKPPIKVTPEDIRNARAQRQLVYLLLERNLNITISVDDNTFYKFIGGWLDQGQGRGKITFIDDTETQYLVLARAHFKWSADKVRDISGPTPDASKLFGEVLRALEDGSEWLYKCDDNASVSTIHAEAIAQTCMPLWRLGYSAYSKICTGLADTDKERHASYLALLAPFTNEGHYTPPDEQTADLLAFINAGMPEQWEHHPSPHQDLPAQPIGISAESTAHASKAVQQLENLVRALTNPDALRRLSEAVPWLGPALQLEAGRMAVQALAQRVAELAGKSDALKLLEVRDAMRLIADIALVCSAPDATDTQANEAVYSLMDAIARKCSKKPVPWKDKWWNTQGLQSWHGLSIFVFTCLKSAWKIQKEGKPPCYKIPADASAQLAKAFVYGQAVDDLNDPWMSVLLSRIEHTGLRARGMYQALQARQKRCKTDNDRKKMLAPAIAVARTCAGLPNLHYLIPVAVNAFLEAVSAWGDPVALVESVPEQERKMLLIAAQGAEAEYLRIDERHRGPLMALLQYLVPETKDAQDVT